jgi:hypothetical protein
VYSSRERWSGAVDAYPRRPVHGPVSAYDARAAGCPRYPPRRRAAAPPGPARRARVCAAMEGPAPRGDAEAMETLQPWCRFGLAHPAPRSWPEAVEKLKRAILKAMLHAGTTLATPQLSSYSPSSSEALPALAAILQLCSSYTPSRARVQLVHLKLYQPSPRPMRRRRRPGRRGGSRPGRPAPLAQRAPCEGPGRRLPPRRRRRAGPTSR